jgi:hypothetical protein
VLAATYMLCCTICYAFSLVTARLLYKTEPKVSL